MIAVGSISSQSAKSTLFRNKWKLVIEHPPLSVGSCHEIETRAAEIESTFGAGIPVGAVQLLNAEISDLAPSPLKLIAETWNLYWKSVLNTSFRLSAVEYKYSEI